MYPDRGHNIKNMLVPCVPSVRVINAAPDFLNVHSPLTRTWHSERMGICLHLEAERACVPLSPGEVPLL